MDFTDSFISVTARVHWFRLIKKKRAAAICSGALVGFQFCTQLYTFCGSDVTINWSISLLAFLTPVRSENEMLLSLHVFFENRNR